MSSKFIIGRGTKVTIAPLLVSDETEPAKGTITTGGTLTAKGATTITVTALAAGIFIPKYTYLGFKSASGKEVLVQLNADAVAAATTLTVVATPEAIAAASTANYPLPIANRTAADIDLKAGTASQVAFEDNGWETSLATSLSGGLQLPGSWSQLDPAYRTLEYQFRNNLNCYVWIEYLPPNSAYSSGTVYKGVFVIESMPVKTPANGMIMGDITLKLTGPLTKVDPIPTA